MPATALKVLQFGLQSVFGTPLAATARAIGVTEYSVTPEHEYAQVAELGSLAPSGLAAVVKAEYSADIQAALTYDDALFYAQGLFGAVVFTPATTYDYAYAAPTAAAVAPSIFTLEHGYPGHAYRLEDAILQTLNLSGEMGGGDGLWMADAHYIATDQDPTTLASLSARSGTLVRMADTLITIDAVGGTMGATVKSDVLISFNLQVDTHRHTKHLAGTITPASWGVDRWEGTLEIVLEVATDSKVIVDEILTNVLVQRQIRIQASTSAIYACAILFAGYVESGAVLFTDRDGNMTVSLTFRGAYNTVYGNWLKFRVLNTLAVLP